MSDYKPIGMFISQNEKGQYVYSDPFIKGGYLILSSQYQKYRVYASRYTISIVVVALLITFIPTKPAIIVGLLTLIVGEVLFRVKYLKTLTYLPDYVNKNKKSLFNTVTNASTRSKKLIKFILYIALAVLIYLNAIQQAYTGGLLIVNYIFAFAAVIFGILNLISYIQGGKK